MKWFSNKCSEFETWNFNWYWFSFEIWTLRVLSLVYYWPQILSTILDNIINQLMLLIDYIIGLSNVDFSVRNWKISVKNWYYNDLPNTHTFYIFTQFTFISHILKQLIVYIIIYLETLLWYYTLYNKQTDNKRSWLSYLCTLPDVLRNNNPKVILV